MKKGITLKDLIHSITWTDLENEILHIYPEESDILTYYKKLFWDLFNLEADANPHKKTLELDLFDEDEIEEFYDEEMVYGEFEGEIEIGMSMERWKKYLGYFISPDLLKQASEETIVAHIFMEATYGGFDEMENEDL